jgi:hypothetical protein
VRDRRVICGQRNVHDNAVHHHSKSIALGTHVRSEGDGAINEASADDARPQQAAEGAMNSRS